MLEEKYCAYLRKSRADAEAELRGEGETLARHKRILTELSEKLQKPISKFYAEVVSGETISDRPVMQELLSDVESGMWKGVYVVEVERLARGNTKDQGIVSDAFKYSDTQIITPSKTYDPDNEFDEEYFEFGLFMSRREYKTINRRLQRGRIASVKEGKYVGSTAPYGYNRVKLKGEKGYTLEINEDTAPVVRMIYDWYCNGELQADGTYTTLGANIIAKKLDLLGIKPPVNDKWSASSIRDILQNETYIGISSLGKRKEIKTSIDGNIVKLRRNSTDYTSAAGRHPALIDKELFDLAQKIRVSNRKNTLPSNTTLQNPLSGLVYCQKCGTLMTRLAPNSRNKYSTLKCPNRYCDNVSSPLFLIEEHIVQFLSDWTHSYELNPAMFEQKSPLNAELLAKENTIKKLDAELNTLRNQLTKAYEFLEKEIYTIEVFRSRESSLQKDIQKLEENKKLLESELERIHSLQLLRNEFQPKAKHFLDTYKDNPAAVNNVILKELIDKVYYIKTERNTRGKLNNCNFELNIFPKLPR